MKEPRGERKRVEKAAAFKMMMVKFLALLADAQRKRRLG